MFEAKNPDIHVEATFDSSGKLQTQIEEGLKADVFMSASQKQMGELIKEDLVAKEDVVDLLENQIVLIVPAGNDQGMKAFEDIVEADMIAIGDPENVPAGQYAKEALTALNLWEQIEPHVTLGTNVTQVLQWVSDQSAKAGIVYATDAKTTSEVEVVAAAPEGSLSKKVIYPVGCIASSEHKKEAEQFLTFLTSDDALHIFETYGFVRY